MRNRVDINKALEEGKKAAAAKKKSDIFGKEDLKKGVIDPSKKRDVTPMPDYYKAWDKFDVDKALSSDEDDNNGVGKITYKEPKPVQSQAEMLKLTSGAPPNTKIVIKGGT